ncbi:MAG: HAMP domain-containing histidine kinase, partial [Spirochaetes bacterium]|nr:HAMP domain-containing histidine kinase [Spirochaetota bacterium]
IQDILDISKIEAKKQELKEEALFLSPVVDACYMMTRESAINADISLTVTIAENLPDLYADEKSLKQIFLNLMSNAIKFTPAGGRVDLKIYLNETNNIVCEVVDSGIGLAKENIPKILLPFTQIENEDYPQGTREGTGLGLTIVKSFTDLYQAELSIDSEPNVGTSVKITFPKSRTMSR